MATASGTLSREYCWSGDRDHNRAASVRAALALALETID
jgi:hypothetical protein